MKNKWRVRHDPTRPEPWMVYQLAETEITDISGTRTLETHELFTVNTKREAKDIAAALNLEEQGKKIPARAAGQYRGKRACPYCGTLNPANGNFCGVCARKIVKVCNCWVLHKPYNCGFYRCPGKSLFLILRPNKPLGALQS